MSPPIDRLTSCARRVSAVALLHVLCACGPGHRPFTPPAEPLVTADRESPLLKEKVLAGELPPLENRLPARPFVAPVFGPNAWYGGTLRIVVDGYWAYGGMDNVFSSRLFLHIPETDDDGRIITDKDGNPKFRFVGNLAESWEVSDDGTKITVRLREGLRYSDGHLFTTEDIAYRWAIWNDTEHYRAVSPVPVVRLNDKPITLEVLDSLTFRFILPEPEPRWLQTGAAQLQFWEAPKHWLGRYDPNLNPSVTDWNEFKRNLGSFSNLERPVLGPWKIVKWDDASEMIAERNPYFHMVDPEGRQLPYIDHVRGFMAKNPEIATMRVMSGLIDIYDGGQVHDLPLLKSAEERGNYRLLFAGEGPGSFPALLINFFTERPGLAGLLRQRDFRIALSLGINREEINDLVFGGFGTPTSASFGPWFTEKHAAFDPARARELLAGIGLADKNGDGILEYAGGGDVTIVITSIPGPYTNVAELIASHWRAIGINAVAQNVHTHQYSVARRNRTFDVLTAHNGSYNLADLERLAAWSPFSVPIDLSRSEGKGLYEPLHRWVLSGGKQGMNPGDHLIDPLVRVLELETKHRTETDPEVSTAVAKEISRIWAEEVFVLGTVGRVPSPLVISRRLLNVPSELKVSPEAIWLRSSLYPFQLVIAPDPKEKRNQE